MRSSRQHMLAVLNCTPGAAVPCCFMLYNGLKAGCEDYLEFIKKQISLGLDTCIQLPPRPPVVVNDNYNLHGLPVSYHPAVKVREWKEALSHERWPVLFKEYVTPVGILRAEVYQDPEWRWGDHVPFLDDYLETRSRKFIVNSQDDLAAFSFLLVPPTEDEINDFHRQSKPVLEFARQNDLLVSGGWGVGADLLGWIFGLQNMVYASHDQPEFLGQLLSLVAAWNRNRMEVVLKAGVDLYIKRAWYENCDFWSPRMWKKFLLPVVREDVTLAHQYGARFGYIITSNCMPLLDLFLEAGIDVLIGVDPARWDLEVIHQKLSGKICLWGGVNGHLTVEMSEEEQVRREVRRALDVFSPGGGFILSPVDNVREDTPRSHKNVLALIDEWLKTGLFY